jgi:drug/metabolite transporter (DMT)-like permease
VTPTRNPIREGIGLASTAALLFGVTIPILKGATEGAGALISGSLLYFGAGTSAALILALRRQPTGRSLFQRPALFRLVALVSVGAVCAPVLLVMGIRRTDAATSSLLLTLEAPFTVVLARLFLREHLGRRALVAAALISCGGLLLASRSPATGNTATGIALVMAAMLGWALDNVISRSLADHDPLTLVALKGAFGGCASAAIAALLGETLPEAGPAGVIFGIGAFGYGLSLYLYLRAQTLVGAARTASVFATAPFLGAAVALSLGSSWPGWHFPVAAALFAMGVSLHVLERHRHTHRHIAITHTHLHDHGDGHHNHLHEPMPTRPHSHEHEHEAVVHEHEHSEDIHHRHPH